MATVQVPVIALDDVSVIITIDSVTLLGLSLTFTPGATHGITWSYTLLGVTSTGSAAAGAPAQTSPLTGLLGNANLSQIVIGTI